MNPGINSENFDGNNARIGYGVGCPQEECSDPDTDGVIGIGLKTQYTPLTVNAAYSSVTVRNNETLPEHYYQAWLFGM